MITINNTEYRNLTEQVQKNKEDIARHYEIDRVIADFGIRVLGRLDSVNDLPEQAAVYGDAYAIGTATPYDYYVWTRANEAIGEPVDYWLDIGSLAIPGPTGPQGEQGERGPQGIPGSKWSSGRGRPTSTTASTGDQYLDTLTGIVYEWTGTIWEGRSSIQGPQGIPGPVGPQGESIIGPQGPQGERGDVGGLVNIAGILSTIDMLPTPSQLQNVTIAYLVGATEPYDLYIQAGTSPATAQWTNAGPFNVGTLIFDTADNAVNTINMTQVLDNNNPKLITSGNLWSQLRGGAALGIRISTSITSKVPTGIGIGDCTPPTSTQCIVLGSQSRASGNYNVAAGVNCGISASHSTVYGENNVNFQNYSVLSGYGLSGRTGLQRQCIYGRYNDNTFSPENAVIIGCGTGDTDRKNGLTITSTEINLMSSPLSSVSPRNITYIEAAYDDDVKNGIYESLGTGDILAEFNSSNEITKMRVRM